MLYTNFNYYRKHGADRLKTTTNLTSFFCTKSQEYVLDINFTNHKSDSSRQQYL